MQLLFWKDHASLSKQYFSVTTLYCNSRTFLYFKKKLKIKKKKPHDLSEIHLDCMMPNSIAVWYQSASWNVHPSPPKKEISLAWRLLHA